MMADRLIGFTGLKSLGSYCGMTPFTISTAFPLTNTTSSVVTTMTTTTAVSGGRNQFWQTNERMPLQGYEEDGNENIFVETVDGRNNSFQALGIGGPT